MSGPLSNLKKSRKTPLPSTYGLKNVPYKPQEAASYSADESKLLDEITGNMAHTRLRDLRMPPSPFVGEGGGGGGAMLDGNYSSARASPAPSKTTPSDGELMGLMMTRLANLESRLQFQAKEIAEKDKRIKILEEKISILNKARASENPDGDAKAELERRCLLLQQQVHEMEAFLADYGMIWVGHESDPSSDVYAEEGLESITESSREKTWCPDDSVARNFEMDYNLVVKNVEELNALAGEGLGEVQKTADGARIKTKESVPLTLYANGMVMFSGPFRPFTDIETQRCLQDLMDGYFPGELQARYPDGVPFVLTDKRAVMFKDKRAEIFAGAGQTLGGETRPSRLVPSNVGGANPNGALTDKRAVMFKDKRAEIFAGAGQTLGGETRPSRLVPTNVGGGGAKYVGGVNTTNKATLAVEDGDRVELEVESELPSFGPKLTTDQFLNKLPASVVKHGKVIDVRQSLGQQLQGGATKASDVTVIETEMVAAMKQRLQLSAESRPPSARDVTTLRIKSERGDHTYVLKMRFKDTIGDVRKYLDETRPKGSGPYQIMSAFPRKSFDKDTATLSECGLTPNATLHLRPG